MGKQYKSVLRFFRTPEYLMFTGIPEVKALKPLTIQWTSHFLWVNREATPRIFDQSSNPAWHTLYKILPYMIEVNIFFQESEGTLRKQSKKTRRGNFRWVFMWYFSWKSVSMGREKSDNALAISLQPKLEWLQTLSKVEYKLDTEMMG